MDIERGEVSPSSAALVLMLDPHRPRGWQVRVECRRRRAWILVFSSAEITNSSSCRSWPLQRRSYKFQNAARFSGKVGVAREDPGSMSPGTDGVFVQPPNGAATDLNDQARARDVLSQVGGAPARQREIVSGRQFTGESFNLNDQFWGKISGPSRTGMFFQTGQTFLEEAFSPQTEDLAARAQARCNLTVAEALGRQQDHFGAHDLKIWQRNILLLSFADRVPRSEREKSYRDLFSAWHRPPSQYHATD
jgi:hypothetical protein